jgi:hypothetical protein
MVAFIHAIPATVTPTIELAKLGLVTSRDEEENEADKGGKDSSNDTDATLADDVPTRYVLAPEQRSNSPAQSPGSMLGKWSRDVEKPPIGMDVDSTVGWWTDVVPMGVRRPARVRDSRGKVDCANVHSKQNHKHIHQGIQNQCHEQIRQLKVRKNNATLFKPLHKC